MWKFQLTIAINFNFNYEQQVFHLKTYIKEIKIDGKAYEVIGKRFKSLFNRCQNNLEISMRGSDFIFDCVCVLNYKCHKINTNRGVSYRFS